MKGMAKAMDHTVSVSASTSVDFEQNRLLSTLEQLLSIQVTDVKSALDQVSDLVTRALGADKVDVFLYTPSIDTLVAVGASDTAMARLERGIGMDRLPLANGGRTVEVFQTGISYSEGRGPGCGCASGCAERSTRTIDDAGTIRGQRRAAGGTSGPF